MNLKAVFNVNFYSYTQNIFSVLLILIFMFHDFSEAKKIKQLKLKFKLLNIKHNDI